MEWTGDGLERRHQCDQCSSSFRRPEHLRRHQRDHTAFGRPFICPVCGKGFSRSDTLQRHELIHKLSAAKGSAGAAAAAAAVEPPRPGPKPGPRINRACISCAQARARCSGGGRCTRCEAKSLRCEYPQKKRRTQRRLDAATAATATPQWHSSSSGSDQSAAHTPPEYLDETRELSQPLTEPFLPTDYFEQRQSSLDPSYRRLSHSPFTNAPTRHDSAVEFEKPPGSTAPGRPDIPANLDPALMAYGALPLQDASAYPASLGQSPPGLHEQYLTPPELPFDQPGLIEDVGSSNSSGGSSSGGGGGGGGGGGFTGQADWYGGTEVYWLPPNYDADVDYSVTLGLNLPIFDQFAPPPTGPHPPPQFPFQDVGALSSQGGSELHPGRPSVPPSLYSNASGEYRSPEWSQHVDRPSRPTAPSQGELGYATSTDGARDACARKVGYAVYYGEQGTVKTHRGFPVPDHLPGAAAAHGPSPDGVMTPPALNGSAFRCIAI